VGRINFSVFTDRCYTIMARSTVIYDASMIEYRTDERAGVMTDTTILRGWNMPR
jgi:hypothetical protein